ncbi:MAG: hypothetical protein R3E01_03315 [Pirellulaceae bacterium]|nr:PD40 domain-containing protein [Planctomycetales bacterium]
MARRIFTIVVALVTSASTISFVFDSRAAAQPLGYFSDVRPVAGLEGPWRDESPWVSDDGLRMYFNSERPNVGSNIQTDKRDIWMATRDSTSSAFDDFTKIESVSVDGASDHYPFLYDDELRLHFTSDRDGGATTYVSTRATRNDDWSAPEAIALGLAAPPDSRAAGIRFTDDRLTAVFSGSVGANGTNSDLFIATRESVDDSFGAPLPITDVNAANREDWHPYITGNGLALFYSRAEPGYLRPDIYVSIRSSTSQDFGTPQRLELAFPGSDNLHFQAATFDPFLTTDWPKSGSKIYFTSANSSADFDIYEATWTTVPEPAALGMITVLIFVLSSMRPHPSSKA